MRVEVRNVIDEYSAEVYTFTLFDLTAVLVGYHKEVKPKGKRKWTIIAFWDKYARHHHNMLPEPELPNSVRLEALTKVFDLIKVKTWDEHKNGN